MNQDGPIGQGGTIRCDVSFGSKGDMAAPKSDFPSSLESGHRRTKSGDPIHPVPTSADPNAYPSGPIKLLLDVTIERVHHADPGEHRRAAALGNQQQRFHRRLPFGGVVFGLGELGDVGGGVTQGNERLALGQFGYSAVPRKPK